MEMESFGPTIKGPHRPDERASIKSQQKFRKYTQEVPGRSYGWCARFRPEQP